MYESITFDVIMQRMLDRVPDSIDKREGSVIYDALAPAAVELAMLYIDFDTILREAFADTASREYLVRRAAERGITPTEATYAVLRGVFTPSTLEIPIGSRYSCEGLNYEVIAKISDGEYRLQCETAGTDGNTLFGALIPIDYVSGLESAELVELLIPGEAEESTEELRTRYFDSFDTSAYGGNIKDYVQKTNSLAGVGATKVAPVWQGGGTVLLTILNSEYDKASDTLIATVQEAMDPEPRGTGLGIAPIDHVVTVRTVTEDTIDVSATFTMDTGYTFDGLKTTIVNAVKEYLLEIRQTWASEENSIVRIAQIESRILAIEGIIDITGTKVNGSTSNLELGEFAIPIMGDVTNA